MKGQWLNRWIAGMVRRLQTTDKRENLHTNEPQVASSCRHAAARAESRAEGVTGRRAGT
jgi:hypothetical protein